MFINPDRKFIFKLARFFLLYFIIYLIVSWFIRDDDKKFISFSNFSNMVVMASFMGIIFSVFDRERSAGSLFNKVHLRQILFGMLLFLCITIPLTLILYFIFISFSQEKINLLSELAKLGFFAILSTVLFSAFIWFWGVVKSRSRKDRDLGGF